MTQTLITTLNGQARPKNPHSQSNPDEYIQAQWDQFESTVQWHDLWDTKFNFRTDFSGDIEAELVWVMYDDNDGYKEWNLSTHPYRDKNDGYLTKQVYMADIPVLKVEKEEAKTVEALQVLNKYCPDFLSGRSEPNGRIHAFYEHDGVIEAMQAYSSQQNTALMEENVRLKNIIIEKDNIIIELEAKIDTLITELP